jgi:hypothetical protein
MIAGLLVFSSQSQRDATPTAKQLLVWVLPQIEMFVDLSEI